MAAVQYYGTGRRKTSTARVFLRPGTGTISVNRRNFDAFFPTEALRTQIRRPLLLTETADKFDILATVGGGGVSGQAGAVRLGISRALVQYNLELRKRLKDEGLLLTRDARAKERKKYEMKLGRGNGSNSANDREDVFGRHRDEGSAGGGGPPRPPDEALEPEDEGIHFR